MGEILKVAYRLRLLPLVLGFILTFYFFLRYMGYAMPYQDYTLELFAKQAEDLKNAAVLILFGIAVIIIGTVYFFVIQRLYNKNNETR